MWCCVHVVLCTCRECDVVYMSCHVHVVPVVLGTYCIGGTIYMWHCVGGVVYM